MNIFQMCQDQSVERKWKRDKRRVLSVWICVSGLYISEEENRYDVLQGITLSTPTLMLRAQTSDTSVFKDKVKNRFDNKE